MLEPKRNHPQWIRTPGTSRNDATERFNYCIYMLAIYKTLNEVKADITTQRYSNPSSNFSSQVCYLESMMALHFPCLSAAASTAQKSHLTFPPKLCKCVQATNCTPGSCPPLQQLENTQFLQTTTTQRFSALCRESSAAPPTVATESAHTRNSPKSFC